MTALDGTRPRGRAGVLVRGLLPVVPLLGAAWLVQRAGTGRLAPPPVTSPDALGAWLDERDAVTAAFAVLRVLVGALAWYLVAVTTLGAVARALDATGLVAVAERALPAPARRVLTGVASAGLATAAVVGVAGPGTVRPTPVPEALVRLPDVAPGAGTATMVVVDDAGSPVPATPAPSAAAADAAATWTVQPGESFWSIAEEVLADGLGRAPSDAEVDPYWRTLVEANRDRLVAPDVPDLLHPGQVLVLPST